MYRAFHWQNEEGCLSVPTGALDEIQPATSGTRAIAIGHKYHSPRLLLSGLHILWDWDYLARLCLDLTFSVALIVMSSRATSPAC
ncbi:hypothetical protein AWENTII_013017 [Aspergillus wentii]